MGTNVDIFKFEVAPKKLFFSWKLGFFCKKKEKRLVQLVEEGKKCQMFCSNQKFKSEKFVQKFSLPFFAAFPDEMAKICLVTRQKHLANDSIDPSMSNLCLHNVSSVLTDFNCSPYRFSIRREWNHISVFDCARANKAWI